MNDINSLFKEMVGDILENGLEAELDEELVYSKYDYRNKDTSNSRNSYATESRIQYAKGRSQNDISSHILEIYGLEVSNSTISRVTDKILPVVKEWQQRPLESIYAVVFMDAIHYHVRCEGRIVKKAVYVAIGINLDGRKEVLGMYVGENESIKYWLSILNGLKNRGVEDILITCIDGLIGFPEAISAGYPNTEIQHCIIHQISDSTKYVSYKDISGRIAPAVKLFIGIVYSIIDDCYIFVFIIQ